MANLSKQEIHAVSQALAVLQKAQPPKGKPPKKKGAKGRPNRSRRPPAATRGLAEIVLAQGVGKVPRNPFKSHSSSGNMLCWDAFHEAHAPLPRAVGPYAVVRTTRIFDSTQKYNIFGTAVDQFNSWTTTFAWSAAGAFADDPINGSGNVYALAIQPPGGQSGLNSSLSCVPAAMSVQIMNPNPVSEAEGIIYAAVCPTQLTMCDNTRKWSEFEQQFTSYMKPRLMSGGKLALRGVQMNSYPLNMSALSNFEKIENYGDATRTWSSTSTVDGDAQYLTGLAPMVVINNSGAKLTYAVTIEYRVRFDLSNPAVASHRLHGVTPDKTWDSMIHKAVSLGNGVKDIVETVATIGQAASKMSALMP